MELRCQHTQTHLAHAALAEVIRDAHKLHDYQLGQADKADDAGRAVKLVSQVPRSRISGMLKYKPKAEGLKHDSQDSGDGRLP